MRTIKMKTGKNRQQGDVRLIRVDGIPSGATMKKPINGKLVLAEGEQTGHLHAVPADKRAEMYERDGVLYLKVKEDTPLTHDEHFKHNVGVGIYKVGIVKEYDHFAEEAREVQD